MSVLERRQEYNKQKKKLAVTEEEKFTKVRWLILSWIRLLKGMWYVGIYRRIWTGENTETLQNTDFSGF